LDDAYCHPRATSLLEISRARKPQRSNLKSYFCSLNVEHLERKESASL